MARVTQAHLDARREDILEAAQNLFLNRGFNNVTMQDIATEAGISAGAIYRYYPGKDELVHAYLERCVGGGPAALVREIAPEAPPLKRLIAIASAVQGMWLESSGDQIISDIQTKMAGIRQPDDIGPMVRDAREQLFDALIEIIEAGQRAGEIDPKFNARALAMSLNAWVAGIGVEALESGEEQLEEQLEQMFGVLIEILNRLGPAADGAA